MVFTKEDLQDPCAYAFCVKRDCNICESLVVERAPNPYSSLTQQFILSHLAHMEFGLNQILEEAHELSAKDFAIISMVENAFIVAKLFNPEANYKQNQSLNNNTSPKQILSTFNKGLQTVENAVSFNKKLLSKMTHQRIVRDDPLKKSFSNKKKLSSSTKEKSKYIGPNNVLDNQSAGCIGYQNVCKSVYPKHTPNKNNTEPVSFPTIPDHPDSKTGTVLSQTPINRVPESITIELEQNSEMKFKNNKLNLLVPANNNINNDPNDTTSRNDVAINLFPSFELTTIPCDTKDIPCLYHTPESSVKDRNQTNLSSIPPDATLSLVDSPPPPPPPPITVDTNEGDGGGHTSGWRTRMNRMLQSSPETLKPHDVTPHTHKLPADYFQDDNSPLFTINSRSLCDKSYSPATNNLLIDHRLYSDSLDQKNAFSSNTGGNVIHASTASSPIANNAASTTVASSSSNYTRPVLQRPNNNNNIDNSNNTLKYTTSSYTTTTTTSSNVSWTNTSQDSNGHHSRCNEPSKAGGGDQTEAIDSLDRGDDISSNDTFSLDYPYHYQDSIPPCTHTRTTSTAEEKGALAKLRRCIRGVIRSNGAARTRAANNNNSYNNTDHAITVLHDS